MRSNRVRMAEQVDWEGMRLSEMSGICPVYTKGYPPTPPPIFSNLADYIYPVWNQCIMNNIEPRKSHIVRLSLRKSLEIVVFLAPKRHY